MATVIVCSALSRATISAAPRATIAPKRKFSSSVVHDDDCEAKDKSKMQQRMDDDDHTFDTTHVYTPLPLIISAKNVGNVARFMNHSYSPNVFWQPSFAVVHLVDDGEQLEAGDVGWNRDDLLVATKVLDSL